MKRSTENTAQIGVNAVEAIFLEMGWLFRRQLESDVGIDAHVEPLSSEGPTGQLIALQIKSGPSFFRKSDGDYVYRASARHLEYWSSFPLPVLLVMHNPDTDETVWCRVERHYFKMNDDGSGNIAIAARAQLNKDAAEAILRSIPASDPESRRRQRMNIDADIIRRAAVEEAYLRFNIWVNKSLNWRGAEIVFGDPDGDSEVKYPFMAAGYAMGELLAELFPWADCEYAQEPQDFSGEVEIHTLSISVNALGRAFLALDDFYRNGALAGPDPETPNDSDLIDADEFDEIMFRRAVEKDRDR